MKRRYFLISALAGVCGLIGWDLERSTDASAVVKVLYKKLSYLKLDADGVQRFARDLAATKSISSARLRSIDAAGPLYTGLALSGHGKLEEGIRHGEERVVTSYLLSSDFFTNGADENRVVRYLHFYDPLIACGNPFARPVIVPTPA